MSPEHVSRDADRFLLQLKGLVYVRELLGERGASEAELQAFTNEIGRVHRKLTRARAE